MKEHGFLRSITLLRDKVESFDRYPFSIPAIRHLDTLDLDPKVTFFVGENGSGKSTLLEAIAVAAGMNAEGGGKNFRFHTRETQSELHKLLRVTRSSRRPRSDYFLRAESFYNVVSTVDDLGVVGGYGGTSLHEMSHGESFFSLVNNRFLPGGLYLLDEPEAALSPKRQLSFLTAIDELRRTGSQLLIATHSPIILAYPHARILQLDQEGMKLSGYDQLEHCWLTKDFLNNRERYLRHLLASEATEEER